ncbi:MAG: type II toxin-antitoxin system YafQ family toxin [Caulobacteraceae bacterium]
MKKPAENRRSGPPRRVEYAKPFPKDWVRLQRSGRYDMRLLKEVMLLLIAGDGPLGPEWRDHPLKGDWAGHRECHVGGDFLLIYRVQDDAPNSAAIVFVRAGTHADLFRE